MASVKNYFWNITFEEDFRTLQNELQQFFTSLSLAIGIALIVLGPIIMITNAIVIAAIWKDPYKQLRSTPSNIIIASMAFCDFLVGVLCISVQGLWLISMSMNWPISGALYAVAYGVGAYFVSTSILHVLALTFDRVLAVCNPLLYKSRVTKRRVKVSVSAIWFVSTVYILLSAPAYNNYYLLSAISMGFFTTIGSPAIFFSFIIIYLVRKHSKELKINSAELNSNLRKITERDRKTTKSILIILAFYVACFSPFFVCWVVLYTCSSCQLSAVLTCFYVSYVIIHFNSCVNPFLYAFRLPKFRKPVTLITKNILTCRFSTVDRELSCENRRSSEVESRELDTKL